MEYVMKKLKLFLVSSVLAVGFLSNSVNAMEADEEASESKSPAVTILDLDGSTSKILRDLPRRDVVSFALTSKVPCRLMWFQEDGKYKKDLLSFLMISPLVAAAHQERDHDQLIKNGGIYRDATINFPASLDLRLAIMDNLPSFHHNQNFTFQINGRAWSISEITFYNFSDSGYPEYVRGLAQGYQLTMENILNIVNAPLSYDPSGAGSATAQFGRDGENYGTFTVSPVKK